jgi:ribonuclease P protein component
MTRSAEFGVTVKYGVRAGQPDLVVHSRRIPDAVDGPRIGLVVSKSVGSAVDRHRVARRLRHAAKAMISELDPSDRLVIRALPGSRQAPWVRLQEELSAGIRRTRDLERRR